MLRNNFIYFARKVHMDQNLLGIKAIKHKK